MSVLLYLAAIVAANLSVAAFGPSVVIVNAFLLIGLDLTLRDHLSEAWEGPNFALRMGTLIFAGGVLSYVVNADAAQIAIASTVAFVLAAGADTYVFRRMSTLPQVRFEKYPYWRPRFTRLERINGSNLAGAAVDSLVFPTLAFGGLDWSVAFGLFAAKVGGGFLWSLVFNAVSVRRRSA